MDVGTQFMHVCSSVCDTNYQAAVREILSLLLFLSFFSYFLIFFALNVIYEVRNLYKKL